MALAAEGNLEARNILIERNLRLVAHIMNMVCARCRLVMSIAVSFGFLCLVV